MTSQDREDGFNKFRRRSNHPGSKRDVDHRVFDGPVPVLLQKESLEELTLRQKGLTQGVQKKALTKTTRTREKIVLTLVHQLFNKRCLVYVIVVFRANDLKTLNPYR